LDPVSIGVAIREKGWMIFLGAGNVDQGRDVFWSSRVPFSGVPTTSLALMDSTRHIPFEKVNKKKPVNA
jgi:hypothetical protein